MTSVLAFQVWDGVGWAGQALFTWRIVHQWLASEKAKKSVLPPSFWVWSLAGTALLLVYTAYRRDPVLILGALVNGSIYARNLWIARPRAAGAPRPRFALWPVLLGLALFTAVTVHAIGPDRGFVRFDRPLAWLAVGFVGQSLWSGRFIVQWWESERRGHSHLPTSFFWMSLGGSVLIFSYAIARTDWVYMAAYALNPIPYARNLVLIARTRRAERAGAPVS